MVLLFYLLAACLWFQGWYTLWPLSLAVLLPEGALLTSAVLLSIAGIWKPRELVGGECSQVKARRARCDGDIALRRAVLDRRSLARKRSDHVEQQPARHDGRPLPLDLRLGLDPNPELEVCRLELNVSALRLDHHTREGLDRAARGGAAHGHAKCGEKAGLIYFDLHSGILE